MENSISIKDYIAMLNVYLDCDCDISVNEIESECHNDISLMCVAVMLQRLRSISLNEDWIETLDQITDKYDSVSGVVDIQRTIDTGAFEDDMLYCTKYVDSIDVKLYIGVGVILDKVFKYAEDTYGKNNVESFIKKSKAVYEDAMSYVAEYKLGSNIDLMDVDACVNYYYGLPYLSEDNDVLLKIMSLLLDSLECNEGSDGMNLLFDSDLVVSTLAEKDMLLLVRRWLRSAKNHDRWLFTSDSATKNFRISERTDDSQEIVDCLVKVINPVTKQPYFIVILDSKTNYVREDNYKAVMRSNKHQLFHYVVKYAGMHSDTFVCGFLFYTIFRDCDIVKELSKDADAIRGSDTGLAFTVDNIGVNLGKYGSLWSYHTEDEPITVHMYNTIDTLFTRLFKMNGVELRYK